MIRGPVVVAERDAREHAQAFGRAWHRATGRGQVQPDRVAACIHGPTPSDRATLWGDTTPRRLAGREWQVR